MTDKKHTCKLDDFPWLTPSLTVKDIPAAMKFYEQAFGFTPDMQMPNEQGTITYGNMRYKGQMVIMLLLESCWDVDAVTPATSKTTSPVGLYVYCEDVDALCKQARAAKAEVLCEPEDMFWGDRTTVMMDPDGHRWTFATMIANFSPQQVETA